MNTKISVVVNTLNEEKNIADCLKSIKDFGDEIIICDMYSDDKTVNIAESYGARIVFHPRTGYVEPARHFAISQATQEWILVLDADERLTTELAQKLREIVREDKYDVAMFSCLYLYFGGWIRHGKFYAAIYPRFFRKEIYLKTYREKENLIHHNFSSLRSWHNIITLPPEYYFIHLAYPTIEKYVCKTIGNYARIEADLYIKAGIKFDIIRLIFEPILVFINRFIINQGFRDGIRGFILAVLYSVFRFTIWANMWFLSNEPYNYDKID